MKRIYLMQLNEVQHKERQYVAVSNRLEGLEAEVDTNSSTEETIQDKIKISAKMNPSYYELKKHKP
jgi:hypothetical protein